MDTWTIGGHLRRSRPAVALIVLTAVLVVQAPSAAGDGIGVSPAKIQIEDGFPGEAATSSVTVQNRLSTATNVTLDLLGELANWTTIAPASGFVMEPGADRTILVNITLPEDASVGTHHGQLRVVAETQDRGEDASSGSSVRTAVTIPLNVTVTGERIVDLQLRAVSAPDVEAGTPPTIQATVSNLGNVVSEVVLEAEVPGPGDRIAGTGNTTATIVPGETRSVPIPLDDALPPGTYAVHVRSPDHSSFNATTHLTVVEVGALGKQGALERILHEPRADTGKPLKVTGRFTNTGNATIARAVFEGDIYSSGELVEVFRTEPRTVPVGESVDLEAVLTPSEPGTYTVVGAVVFDGIESRPVESTVQVSGTDTRLQAQVYTPGPGLWVLAGLGAAAVLHSRRRACKDGM